MFCGTQTRGIRVPNIHGRYDPPPFLLFLAKLHLWFGHCPLLSQSIITTSF